MVKRGSIFSRDTLPEVLGLISSIIILISSLIGRDNISRLSSVIPIIMIVIFSIAIISIAVLIFFKVNQHREEKQLLETCKKFGIDVIEPPNESGNDSIHHRFIEDELKKRGVLEELKEPNKKTIVKNISRIDIIYTTGSPFFRNFKDTFTQSIKMNAKIRILIATKETDFIKDLAGIQIDGEESPETKNLNENIAEVERIISEVNSDAAKNDKKIELKHYTTEFRNTIVLIEATETIKIKETKGIIKTKETKQRFGFITLMLPPRKSRNSLLFRISDTENALSLYKMSEKHFQKVWERAK